MRHGSRTMLAAVLLSYLLIFGAALTFGWTRAWSAVGVRPMPLPFGDLRGITGAPRTMAAGLDPLIDNIGDPWHRPANCPRLWLRSAAAAGITEDDTVAVGLALFALFVVSLWLLARLARSPGDHVLLYLFAVSPAALLAVERGKIDLAPLLLVCMSLAAWRRPWVRAGALTAAALLKLFPVFGLVAAGAFGRRSRWPAAAGLAVFGVYAYVARHDLVLILISIPVDAIGAYGLPSLAKDLWQGSHGRIPEAVAPAIAIAVAGGGCAAGCLAGVRLAGSGAASVRLTVEQRAGLTVASAIYVGTYFAGSNYDYRLVFLAPALPALNAWRREASASGWIGTCALMVMGTAMCETPLTLALGRAGVALNVAAKLLLAGVLVCATTMAVRRARVRDAQSRCLA